MTIKKTDHGIWASIRGINPEPWESPQASAFLKDGRPVARMRSTPRHRAFKESVQEEFPVQNPGWMNFGAMPLDVTFFLWREVVDYTDDETGRKKKGGFADATNCQKSLEDALQGLLYHNDVNNQRVQTHIVAQDYDVAPFILIRVHFDPRLDPKIEDLAIELGKGLPLYNGSIAEELGDERDIF